MSKDRVITEGQVKHNGKPVMYADLRAAPETKHNGHTGKWTCWGFMMKPDQPKPAAKKIYEPEKPVETDEPKSKSKDRWK